MRTESKSLMGTSNYCFCILALVTSLVIPTECHGHAQPTKKQAALFIFGDSLVDAGNNDYINTTTNFQANFRPYGESYFKYPTGRFCDGRLIPDFIAEFANLPLIPPYLQPGNNFLGYGANFASAGAGALATTYPGLVIDLKTQLRNFKKLEKQFREKLGEKKAEQLVSNAVYFFNVGTNDYFSPFVINSTTIFSSFAREKYVNVVIGNMTSIIKGIYKKGGRKFGILNVGPLGCIPRSLTNGGECWQEIDKLVRLHNRVLHEKLKKLNKQLKGVTCADFNFYKLVVNVLKNPSKYGFKEGKSACCGSGPYRGITSCGGKRGVKQYQLCNNPNEYLFFDSVHPTQKANQLFAKIIWDGTPNVTNSYNLKSLFQTQQA